MNWREYRKQRRSNPEARPPHAAVAQLPQLGALHKDISTSEIRAAVLEAVRYSSAWERIFQSSSSPPFEVLTVIASHNSECHMLEVGVTITDREPLHHVPSALIASLMDHYTLRGQTFVFSSIEMAARPIGSHTHRAWVTMARHSTPKY